MMTDFSDAFDEMNPARKYYRVASGPCHVALLAWREQRQAINDQCFDFAKSVGGTGFYAGHDDNVGNALAINAVTFKDAPPSGWKRRNWKSLKVTKRDQVPCWPDQRTTAGKDALKAIKALPLRPSTNHVCDAIEAPHAIKYEKDGQSGCSSLGFWDTMTVGWMGETFYVSLPDYDRARRRYEADGYTVTTPPWSPVEGMEPILKEEMDLDFAREKARRADESVAA